ncbi:MAG: hypothetical protein IKM06_07080 [Clostridia bacterium]|nr:hypothetical protein [Clostridia bacterium]
MSKKKESVVLTVLLVILIICLIGVIFFVLIRAGVPLPFLKQQKHSALEKALNENNYQAAYTAYAQAADPSIEAVTLEAHLNTYFDLCFSAEYDDTVWPRYRGIEVFNEVIKDKVLLKLDETVSRYYGGEFTEAEVKTYLSRIAKFSFAKEKLTDSVEEVENKNASDKAYLDGVNYFTEGKYKEAVYEFKKVSPQDTGRYPHALEGIERAQNEWGSVKLEEARQMIKVYNNEGATALLEELIETFGTYDEAKELLDSIEYKFEE